MKSLLLLFFCLASLGLQAQESYVDLRATNISGKVIDVPAPNVLHVKTKKDGEDRAFYVELIHVDFGPERNISCKGNLPKKSGLPNFKQSCNRMEKWLDGKDIHIEITEWSQPITKGFAFVDSMNINYELIARGWYQADYSQSRDAFLVLLEKRARCQRMGIWESKIGIPEEDMKCQD